MTNVAAMTPGQIAAVVAVRRTGMHRALQTDSASILQTVRQATHQAWLTLEVALAGKAAWQPISKALSSAQAKRFRQQMDALLDILTMAGLPGESPGSRQRCFEELRAARHARLDTIEDLDAWEQGPTTERETLAAMTRAAEQAGYTLVARLLGLRLPWGEPIFVAMVEYFLRHTLRAESAIAIEPCEKGGTGNSRWRCLEIIARLLEQRADQGQALLDRIDVSAAGAQPAHDDEAIERLFQQGLGRFLHGDYQQAVVHFTAALKLDAADARLYAYRGDAYRLQGEHERAIADFEVALRLQPANLSVLVSRAHAYHRSSEHARAVADCRAALVENPHHAPAYRLRAAAYAELGSHDLALADLTSALTLAPQDDEAYFQRGVIHLGKRAYSRAIADFNQALKLNRHRAAAYERRGQAQRCLGDYSSAIRDFTEVLRRHPNHVPAYAGRGSAYRLKGDLARAQADYEKALSLEPANSRVHCSQGVLFRIKGDLERARTELNEAVRLEPGNWSALYHRGKITLLQGLFEEALADLSAALSINARIPVAYLSRAVVLDHLGRHQEALADGARAIELEPRQAVARLVRGVVHSHLGDYPTAIGEFTEAIQLDPGLALAFQERGIAYTLRREYSRALADCNQVVTLEPGNASAYAHRSIVYQLMADAQKALEDYCRAMQLDPHCLLPAWDQHQASSARLQTARRLADLIDGFRQQGSLDQAPLPPDFQIVLQQWPRGLAPVKRARAGKPAAMLTPPRERQTAQHAPSDTSQAAAAPTASPRPAAACQSMPEVVLDPMDRPVWKSSDRFAPLERYDEEIVDDYERARKRRALGIGISVAAMIAVAVFYWFHRPVHIAVYPAHGQIYFEGKIIPNAALRFDPVWTKDPVFPRPHAIVREDGTFVVGTYTTKDGAPAGEYRVSVQLMMKPNANADSEGGKLPQNVLPPRYANFDTSGLTVQIQEGDNALPPLQLKR